MSLLLDFPHRNKQKLWVYCIFYSYTFSKYLAYNFYCSARGGENIMMITPYVYPDVYCGAPVR